MKYDEDIKKILNEQEKPTLSEQFESRLLNEFIKQKKLKEAKNKYLKLSWIFFGIGLIVGSIVTTIWVSPFSFDIILPAERIIFAFQIAGIFIFLLFFNELIKTTFFRKKKNEF